MNHDRVTPKVQSGHGSYYLLPSKMSLECTCIQATNVISGSCFCTKRLAQGKVY